MLPRSDDGTEIGRRDSNPKSNQFFVRGLAQGAHVLTLQPLCEHAPCLLEQPTITRFTVRDVGVAIDDGPLMVRDAGSIGCVEHRSLGQYCCFTSQQHYQSGFYRRSMDTSHFLSMVENTPSNCTQAGDALEVASFIAGLVNIPLIDMLRLDAFLLDKLTPTEHRMRAARSWPIILPGARLSPEYFAPEDRDVNTQDDVPEQGRMIAVLIASFDDMAMLGYLPVAAAAWKRIVGVEPVVVLCNTTIEGVAHGSAVQLAYWHIVREELSRLSVGVESIRSHWAACQINGLRHAIMARPSAAFVWYADARVLPRCKRCFHDRNFDAARLHVFETPATNHWGCADGSPTPYVGASVDAWAELLARVPDASLRVSDSVSSAQSAACYQSAPS